MPSNIREVNRKRYTFKTEGPEHERRTKSTMRMTAQTPQISEILLTHYLKRKHFRFIESEDSSSSYMSRKMSNNKGKKVRTTMLTEGSEPLQNFFESEGSSMLRNNKKYRLNDIVKWRAKNVQSRC